MVEALESKVGEYRQRLRVLEVAQEQMEAGWEEARQAREAEWHERLATAEEARSVLCASLCYGHLMGLWASEFTKMLGHQLTIVR